MTLERRARGRRRPSAGRRRGRRPDPQGHRRRRAPAHPRGPAADRRPPPDRARPGEGPDISPATVSEAWQALGAVGAIRARGRAGTFVRDTVEPTRPTRYLGIGGAPLAEGVNLSSGTPDPALLPPLREAVDRVVARSTAWTTSYLDDPVLPELDALLRRDWPFPPARLTVVDGALDALSRVVEQVVRLGDRVVMENPGFPPLIDILDRAGAEIVAVDLDDEGIVPESLEAALALDPVAVFVQPRAQNPTGISMGVGRCARAGPGAAGQPGGDRRGRPLRRHRDRGGRQPGHAPARPDRPHPQLLQVARPRPAHRRRGRIGRRHRSRWCPVACWARAGPAGCCRRCWWSCSPIRRRSRRSPAPARPTPCAAWPSAPDWRGRAS